MKHIIIGTAGHIDHGKTTLVKALTGVDTDRLKEEKKRGISIDLGFAEFKLPSGQVAGVVDVPGHERFVKNMLAGATGMDLVLLVVAADDGVMPQTEEHLAIANLLGVKKAIVALAKVDLVEEEWLEIVEEDIKSLLKGTTFEDAPIIRVSPVTGFGLEKLLHEMGKIASEVAPKDTDSPYRLPIDRAFSLKGVGTVVTGTLWSGEISLDEQVVILPKGLSSRVRSIQVHSHNVEKAYAGQRVALNLVGVEVGELKRGDVILPPDYLSLSRRFDAKLYLLPVWSKPLKNGTRVRIHHGTQEVMGRIMLLGKDELLPGEVGYAQLRLEGPIVPKRGDRFIIRSYSPIHTIGGGQILDSHPQKHKRFHTELLEQMKLLEEGKSMELVRLALREAKIPLSASEVANRFELLGSEVGPDLSSLVQKGEIEILPSEGEDIYIPSSEYQRSKERILNYLEEYLRENPFSFGVKKEMVRAQILAHLPLKMVNVLFNKLISSGSIVQEGDILRHPKKGFELTAEQKKLYNRVYHFLSKQKFAPPGLKELSESTCVGMEELKALLERLSSEGKVVKVRYDMYFSREAVEEAKERIIVFLREKENITPAEFKALLGTTRKYALPLLEYFDTLKITRRIGDYRVLQ
ncbi:MAG: selenocysteine-specific translation elongation factor [Actinomycetota bacterium]|nr:selenocysteine-specific translation elongation factor [Actinomycetota bacterium]